MGVLDRLDHLDEQVGARPRKPCPECVREIQTMPIPDEIPLGVRLRFASGLRVPREYVPWALREIRREAWPVRQVFTRLPFMMLLTLGVYAVLALIRIGSGPLPWWPIFVIQPVTWLVGGSWLGAFHPNWYRGFALRGCMARPRGGCPIHDGAP